MLYLILGFERIYSSTLLINVKKKIYNMINLEKLNQTNKERNKELYDVYELLKSNKNKNNNKVSNSI